MPQVLDRGGGEGALGPLDVQLMLAEDGAELLQVHGLGGAIDEDVIKEDEDTPT